MAEITNVTWAIRANQAKGTASTTRSAGKTSWIVNNVPLAAEKTSVIVVTATLNTTWAPAFGGNTTFSDTVSVFSTPVRLSLTRKGGEAVLDWTGGLPPFSVQGIPTVSASTWSEALPDAPPPVTVPISAASSFFRDIGK